MEVFFILSQITWLGATERLQFRKALELCSWIRQDKLCKNFSGEVGQQKKTCSEYFSQAMHTVWNILNFACEPHAIDGSIIEILFVEIRCSQRSVLKRVTNTREDRCSNFFCCTRLAEHPASFSRITQVYTACGKLVFFHEYPGNEFILCIVDGETIRSIISGGFLYETSTKYQQLLLSFIFRLISCRPSISQ